MSTYRKIINSAGMRGWAKLAPFSYNLVLSPSALADGASISGQITTDTGNPFIMTELRCMTDADTNDVKQVPNTLWSIVDGANQMLFSNQALPREHMFGTRDFPRQLPTEVEILPADTLTITMTNKTGGALTTNARVTLTGYRLVGFYQSKPSEA